MIDNKEAVKTNTSAEIIGARRYRRTSRNGPNWFVIIASIAITIAIAIALGNMIGSYILGSGRVFKNNGQVPGIVIADPSLIKQDEKHSRADSSESASQDRKPVRFPSLVLPPNASGKEQIEEPSDNNIDVLDKNKTNETNDTIDKQDNASSQVDQQNNDKNKTDQTNAIDKENNDKQEQNKDAKNSLKELYKVQAGLFLREDNAKAQVLRLAQDGAKAYVERVPKNGSYFYRVQVEGFKDKNSAHNKARELSKKGYSTFVIGE